MEKNVHQRLAEAMRVVKYIQSEKRNGMQYATVSHDSVTAKARPALLDAGIVYYPVRCGHTQSGNRTEVNMTVRFVNIDKPDDFFDVPSIGYGVDPQDKGPGKAMSYAVKYALLKALGLETGEDADNESINHTPKDPARNTPPTVIEAIGGAETQDSLMSVWRANRDLCGDNADFIAALKKRKQELEKEAA